MISDISSNMLALEMHLQSNLGGRGKSLKALSVCPAWRAILDGGMKDGNIKAQTKNNPLT